MHGLVSLLPQPYYDEVEKLWRELAEEHDLHGIHVTPYPHFSWQIAQDYNLELLEATVKEICADTPPLNVRTAGLGLFSGVRPVLFIPVVKDAALFTLHARIWEAVAPASQGASPYYAPSSWVPHISLAYEDMDETKIGPVMRSLAFRTFNWEMVVEEIALIYEPDGEIGALHFRHSFSG